MHPLIQLFLLPEKYSYSLEIARKIYDPAPRITTSYHTLLSIKNYFLRYSPGPIASIIQDEYQKAKHRHLI